MIVVSGAFKSRSEELDYPPTLIPRNFVGFENFIEIFQHGGRYAFGKYFRNSSIVTISTTLIALFTSTLAGYIFAKFSFRGRNILFFVILSTMMIPIPVIVIPLFLMMSAFRWVNTFWALIIPGLVYPFGIFLMRQFIKTIPDSFMDAARLDGASEWRIYLRVIIPLTKAAFFALVMMLFLRSWNDFLWPLIVIEQSTKWVLSVGIVQAVQENIDETINRSLLYAAIIVTILPPIMIFVAVQRYFTGGLILTGMKE